TWRPGADYIELPDRKFSIGSKYPTINASITSGIHGLFGSNVDYTKWKLTISDELDLKLMGQLKYNIGFSGFFDSAKTFIPDYNHIIGNQTIFASRELNSFQLAPYYLYSNNQKFNIQAHAEYHFNGLISNKIPGFKKLNWFFVTGVNALHIDKGADYVEWSFGIENIFKVIRVDYVLGFPKDGGKPSGFRFTLPFF
ncbi:MAG: hypothetical protein RLZZ28_2180, partial [Bacteroidota bacterium]